jgi:hypothetical protein
MNSNYVVRNSLEFYDKNKKKYENFFNKIYFIEMEYNDSDIEHNIIKLYDKNRKLLLKSRFEQLGIYIKAANTWIWAWALAYHKKNSTNISRHLWKYGIDLELENSTLKTELINSRFNITHEFQLSIHIAIASYLSKIPMILKHRFYPDLYLAKNDEIRKNNTSHHKLYYFNYDDIFQKYKDDDNAIDEETFNLNYYFLLDYNKLLDDPD